MSSDQLRSWSDLPLEIVSSIADRLPLLELLSFRGTCKDFRSASTSATAKNGSQMPWLLFHKSDNSECRIYDQCKHKTYQRNINDLQGAICLASYQGWLLLFKDESVYFFSPFSLAKIAVPDFPHAIIDSHVGAFSDLPTSPNCVVSVIRPIDDEFVEVNVISKGQSSWTQHKIHKAFTLKSAIVAATFDHETQTFYYLDSGESVLTFSVKDKISTPYRVVKNDALHKRVEPLPYSFSGNKYRDQIEKNGYSADVEDDEYVAVCGLTYEHVKSRPYVYLNEVVGVSPAKTSVRRAVWVQPRFFEARSNLRW